MGLTENLGSSLSSSLRTTDWQKGLLKSRLAATTLSAASPLEFAGRQTGLESSLGGLINTVI